MSAGCVRDSHKAPTGWFASFTQYRIVKVYFYRMVEKVLANLSVIVVRCLVGRVVVGYCLYTPSYPVAKASR